MTFISVLHLTTFENVVFGIQSLKHKRTLEYQMIRLFICSSILLHGILVPVILSQPYRLRLNDNELVDGAKPLDWVLGTHNNKLGMQYSLFFSFSIIA